MTPKTDVDLYKMLCLMIEGFSASRPGGVATEDELLEPLGKALADVLNATPCAACRYFYTAKFANTLLMNLGYEIIEPPPEVMQHMAQKQLAATDIRQMQPVGSA